MAREDRIEGPTLALIFGCYAVWTAATWSADAIGLWLAIPLAALTLVLHSSLQHEALHGHPTRWPLVNEMLVFPALGLAIPYRRFRDTHLAHHRNEILTDPYDDPESNYLDPKVWRAHPRWRRGLLRMNNTLMGRMVLGPVLGLAAFFSSEWAEADQPRLQKAWALHFLGLVPVILWLSLASMPVWVYLLSAYAALSILKIRTFLEHRADERAAGRSVIIEDRGPLSFLFMNNNFHAVHHAHPKLAWYRLPALYRARRDVFLRRNGGYRYQSYGAVLRAHILHAKDPVPHPLMPE